MTVKDVEHFSLGFWNQIIGKDLPVSESQPLQPVRIDKRKLKLFAGKVLWMPEYLPFGGTPTSRFSPGTRVGFNLHGNHVILEEVPDGEPVQEASFWDEWEQLELNVPKEIQEIFPQSEPLFGMLITNQDYLELVPISVQEHDPDIMGPRIIDELQDSSDENRPVTLVRHIVRGFEYEDWTNERLHELEELVCSKSLSYDPLKELKTCEDWIGWKVRNEILQQPAANDEKLRKDLTNEIFEGQTENGSWDNHVVKTAYGILRALSIHVPSGDSRIQKAAQWLIEWPEPAGRPGMWMQTKEHLREWNAIKNGETKTDRDQYFDPRTFTEEDHDLYRGLEQQQVIPTCCRNYGAVCYSRMLHPAATVAYALCRCGYSEHRRVRDYANTMLQVGGMFGYFCSCWGIVDFDVEVEDLRGKEPDFNQRRDEYKVALESIPYGYARDSVDLQILARHPQYPGIHRPDLADTNGWWPYDWKEIGVENHSALVGSYWQNADCWAKSNRALSQFPEWSGSIAEFFALFQCHLYQTSLGEWNQGFPAGIFRLIAEITRITRTKHTFEDSQLLRFAGVILLKTVPWLREHQREDGLWAHDDLPRFGQGRLNQPLSPRLATYHIVSVLDEFNLLEKLLPQM